MEEDRPSTSDGSELTAEPSRDDIADGRDGFGEFISAGDAAVDPSPPAEAGPAASTSAGSRTSSPVRRSGTSSPTTSATGSTSRRHRSASASPIRDPGSPGFSFQGLLHNVSRSFENTLETAKREIGRNDALANAQSGMAQLAGVLPGGSPTSHSRGATVPSSSEGTSRNRGSGASAVAHLEHGERIAETSAMRVFHLNTFGHKLLWAFRHPDTQCIIAVTDEKLFYLPLLSTATLEVLTSALLGGSDDTDVPDEGGVWCGRGQGQSSPSSVAGPVEPTCATYLPVTDELVVGRADGTLAFYSTKQDNPGCLTRTGDVPGASGSGVVCVHVLPSKPAHIAVGCYDGSVIVVDAHELTSARRIPPPEISAAPVGLPDAPLRCLDFVFPPTSSGDMSIERKEGEVLFASGYGDGAVSSSEGESVSFVAHCEDVTGVIAMMGGVLCVTIGSEADPCICVTNSVKGSCLGRRALPYCPTSIARVEQSSIADCVNLEDGVAFSPSTTAFLVGGVDGQVDLLRVVVLSLSRVEVRLVARISERVRGRNVAVKHFIVDQTGEIVVAVSGGGALRRWRLGLVESQAVLGAVQINPARLLEDLVRNDGVVPPVDSRLSASDDVVAAQHILATLLQEDSLGIPEETKDSIVETFQSRQSQMCEAGGRADKELWRAKNRIHRRFSKGILATQGRELSSADAALRAAVLQVASFELDIAERRHKEHIAKVQLQAMSRLQGDLLACLRVAQGDVNKIVETKNAIHALLS